MITRTFERCDATVLIVSRLFPKGKKSFRLSRKMSQRKILRSRRNFITRIVFPFFPFLYFGGRQNRLRKEHRFLGWIRRLSIRRRNSYNETISFHFGSFGFVSQWNLLFGFVPWRSVSGSCACVSVSSAFIPSSRIELLEGYKEPRTANKFLAVQDNRGIIGHGYNSAWILDTIVLGTCYSRIGYSTTMIIIVAHANNRKHIYVQSCQRGSANTEPEVRSPKVVTIPSVVASYRASSR